MAGVKESSKVEMKWLRVAGLFVVALGGLYIGFVDGMIRRDFKWGATLGKVHLTGVGAVASGLIVILISLSLIVAAFRMARDEE